MADFMPTYAHAHIHVRSYILSHAHIESMVFLAWTMVLLTIFMVLQIHQYDLNRKHSGEGSSSRTVTNYLQRSSAHISMTMSLPSSLCLLPCIMRPTPPQPFPKQQHLCFSHFSRFPTLNATQTSPSALLRPLWKPTQ